MNSSAQAEGSEYLLDRNALRKLAEDTAADLVPAMVTIFIDELHDQVDTITAAARSVDLDSLQRESHVVKGSAALFGTPGVRVSAERLNAACREGNSELALSFIDELLTEIPLAIRALQEHFDLPARDQDADSNVAEKGQ